MIRELATFVDEIPEEYHTEGLKASPGLHVVIGIDDNGNLKSYQSYVVNKKRECFDRDDKGELRQVETPKDLPLREYFSRVIDSNKAVDTTKKIYSSVPYALWIKPEKFADVKVSFELFFENAKRYINDDAETLVNVIERFCRKQLIETLKKDPKLKQIKATDWVRVYFDVPIEQQRQAFDNYLQQRLFVKDDYNIDTKDGNTYGLHGFLSGDNQKKQFMRHVTTPFLVGSRVPKDLTVKLYKFERLLANKRLPNPVPVFIDRDELNREVVKLYNREGVVRFREIIRQLFERGYHDLSNYYLLNWTNTKSGVDIRDFDFVPLFRYELEGFELKNTLGISDFQRKAIKNIFSFESEIVTTIFDNALVVRSKNNELILKYFDEIDPQYVKSQAVYVNILKYRQAFYDYIYKSRTESINAQIFYDVVMTSILEDIRLDEDLKKTPFIRGKLNILFSLNKQFDPNNNNFGGIDMASLIPQFTEMMRNLLKDEGSYHLSTDQEFAYASGQLIYYILYQSQTSNKTHSLLEPYISKNDPVLFKGMITRGIEQYKHALNFGHRRFNKLASEVLGYECTTPIKELLPVILAGYFSNSMIFEKTNN
jgi:CRISPR-associated protein Csh1